MHYKIKIFFLIIICYLPWSRCGQGLCAQKKRFFKDGPTEKYFVAVSYGLGNASWNSKINTGSLYDTSGTEMFSGNINFKAKNAYKSINLDVLAPIGKISMGLGISFEDFFIQKIKINSNQYYFAEKFRFEKIYTQLEIPIDHFSNDFFTFNVKVQAGYYGFSYINHIDFFGSDINASVLFINTGILIDYKAFKHLYAFLIPICEYKYFRTNLTERPTVIIHNIFSYGIQFGIRFDVAKE